MARLVAKFTKFSLDLMEFTILSMLYHCLIICDYHYTPFITFQSETLYHPPPIATHDHHHPPRSPLHTTTTTLKSSNFSLDIKLYSTIVVPYFIMSSFHLIPITEMKSATERLHHPKSHLTQLTKHLYYEISFLHLFSPTKLHH